MSITMKSSFPGDSSRDLLGMVSSHDPFGENVTSNNSGMKFGHLESPNFFG